MFKATLKKATFAYEKGNYEKARSLLHKVIDKKPRRAEAYRLLGYTNAQSDKKDDLKAAAQNFASAADYSEDNKSKADMWHECSKIYIKLGDYENALLALNNALAHKSGNNNKILTERSGLYYYLECFQEALNDINKVLKSSRHTCSNSTGGWFYECEHIRLKNNIEASIRGEVARLNAQGVQHLQAKQWDEAIEKFSSALKLDEKNVFSLVRCGEAKRRKGLCDDSLIDCNQAIDLDPNDYFARSVRATVWFEQGEYQKAIDDFNAQGSRNRRDTSALYLRGQSYYALSLYEKAYKDFNLVFFLNNQDFHALLWRGKAELKMEMYTEALQDFENVLFHRPDYSEARDGREEAIRMLVQYYTNIGESAIMNSQYQVAIDNFSHVLYFDRQNFTALRQRAEAHRLYGNFSNSIQDFNEFIRHHPSDSFALSHRGDAKRSSNNLPEALLDLQSALSISPNDSFALSRLGATQCQINEPNLALSNLNLAIQNGCRDAFVLAYCGKAECMLDKLESSLLYFNEALDLEPDNVFALAGRSETNYLIGHNDASKKQEKLTAALADLRSVMQLRGQTSANLTQYGKISTELQSYEVAISCFTRALRLDENNINALVGRSIAHCESGKFRAALCDTSTILWNNPSELHIISALKVSVQAKMKSQPADFVGAIRDMESLKPLVQDDLQVDQIDIQLRQLIKNKIPELISNAQSKMRLYRADYHQAIEVLNVVLWVQPGNTSALYRRGEAKYELCEQSYVTPKLYSLLGLFVHHDDSRTKMLESALSDFNSVVESEKYNTLALEKRGEIKLVLRLPDALSDFDRVIDSKSDRDSPASSVRDGFTLYSFALSRRAIYFYSKREFKKAARDFKAAYPIGKNRVSTYGLILAQLYSEEFKEALETLEIAQQKYAFDDRLKKVADIVHSAVQGHVKSLINDAQNEYHEGEYENAIESCTYVIDIESNNITAFSIRGDSYYASRMDRDALHDYGVVLKAQPGNITILMRHAELSNLLRDADAALHDYNQIIKRDPGNAMALHERSKIRFKNDLVGAFQDISEAKRLSNNQFIAKTYNKIENAVKGRRSELMKIIAKEYRDKNYKSTIKYCDEMLDLKGQNFDVFAWRGEANRMLDRLQDAVQDYTNALRIKSNDLSIRKCRLLTYYILEKYAEALDDIQYILSNISRRDIFSLQHLSKIKYHQGKFSEALRAIDEAWRLDSLNKLTREIKQEVSGAIESERRKKLDNERNESERIEREQRTLEYKRQTVAATNAQRQAALAAAATQAQQRATLALIADAATDAQRQATLAATVAVDVKKQADLAAAAAQAQRQADLAATAAARAQKQVALAAAVTATIEVKKPADSTTVVPATTETKLQNTCSGQNRESQKEVEDPNWAPKLNAKRHEAWGKIGELNKTRASAQEHADNLRSKLQSDNNYDNVTQEQVDEADKAVEAINAQWWQTSGEIDQCEEEWRKYS